MRRRPSSVGRFAGRPRRRSVTKAEEAEYKACHPQNGVAGFLRWCRRWARIQDKLTGRAVPFDPFPGQLRVIPNLVGGDWLIILKARQLGCTWLLAAYALWRLTFHFGYECAVVSQRLLYAKQFIWRVRYIYDRLPDWCRPQLTSRAIHSLRWEARGKHCWIISLAGSQEAARSMSADLFICDEASRIPEFGEVVVAMEDALEVAKGQFIVQSTSAGPQGGFYALWQRTYGESGELLDPDGRGPSGFKPVFLHWSERPGRDAAWYEKRKRELDQVSPVAIYHEHPSTPDEAWQYAAGRVYATFRRDVHVGEMAIPDGADRYRGIDWGGGQSAFVCLWAVHVPGKPGLLIHPSCVNLIREMIAYRYDPDYPDRLLKADDHAPDALRYLVTRWNLDGVVYVYRELYEKDSAARGATYASDAHDIHTASGWILAPDDSRNFYVRGRGGERFVGSVADRSNPKAIQEFNSRDLPTVGHAAPVKKGGDDAHRANDQQEREAGINHVRMLLSGQYLIAKERVIGRAEQALRVYSKYRAAPVRYQPTGAELEALELAADILHQRGLLK